MNKDYCDWCGEEMPLCVEGTLTKFGVLGEVDSEEEICFACLKKINKLKRQIKKDKKK